MIGIYGNGVQMTEKVLDFLWNRQKHYGQGHKRQTTKRGLLTTNKG